MEDPLGALVIKSGCAACCAYRRRASSDCDHAGCARYLACPGAVKDGLSEQALQHTPMLFCHGDADPMVRPEWGAASFNQVKEWGGADVRMKTYPGMEHSACEEELRDVVNFVSEVVPMLPDDEL